MSSSSSSSVSKKPSMDNTIEPSSSSTSGTNHPSIPSTPSSFSSSSSASSLPPSSFANENVSSSASTSSSFSSSSTSSTVSAIPTQRKPLWRRYCNCTNIFTFLFFLYMVTNFYFLYTVAVPHIPPVTRLQDGLLPYWRTPTTKLSTDLTLPVARTPSSLRLYLALSLTNSHRYVTTSSSSSSSPHNLALGPSTLFTIPTNESIPLLTIGNLPYDWTIGEHQDIHLLFHILRSPPVRVQTIDDTTTTTMNPRQRTTTTEEYDSSTGKGKSKSRITGLKITCDTNPDNYNPNDDQYPNVCVEYAKEWMKKFHPVIASSTTATHPVIDTQQQSIPIAGSDSTKSNVFTEGILVSLYKYAYSFFTQYSSVSSSSLSKEYIIYESTDAFALEVARTLARVHSSSSSSPLVKNIRLSASIGWEGIIPDATVQLHDILGAPTVLNTDEPEEKETKNNEEEKEKEKKKNILPPSSQRLAYVNFTEPHDSDKLIQSKTELITSLPYEAPKFVRYLWTDFFIENPDRLHQVSSFLGIPYETLFTGKNIFHDTGLQMTMSGSTIGHWIGQVDLKFIMDTVLVPRASQLVPAAIRSYIRTNADRQGYLPFLKANPVRPLRERHYVLNKTVTTLPLAVRLSGISIGTWQFMNIMDQSLHLQREIGASERDTDDIVRLISDTPLILLAVTFIVSFVHLLFDVLAMKNDISFWNNTSNLRGISIRTLSSQFISQTIIFLFLYQEGSSLLVLIPQAGFTFLLVWKILIASGLRWKLYFRIIPVPYYDARIVATTKEGNTAKYDQEAITYMTTLLAPLLIGYAVYAVLYNQYTSWYSWGLSTAVSMVYSFGFILMTPQLWINYRLQSVPNLPWKVFGYRFFNTIIDDLFATIIKMPFMHRVSVFRDDVVFIIYMIQRRIYPVDSGRTEGYDDDDDDDGSNNNSSSRDISSSQIYSNENKIMNTSVSSLLPSEKTLMMEKKLQ